MKIIDIILFHISQPRLRIIKSIYLNFKLLPLKQAIKLPILIYGPVKFYWLKGKIIINSNDVFRGMIKLGRNNEFFNGIDKSSFILIDKGAELIFNGPCSISNNYKIRIAQNAKIEFGAYTFFGSSIKFICTKYIKIGKYTRCAFESQFIDSNFHFVYNEVKQCVTKRDGKICIGDYNWIGNRTTITKDTKTKDRTIVCAGSLLNKDYTKYEEEKQMLGGQPAKLIASGLRRIFSTETENSIIEYFDKNKNARTYDLRINEFEENLNDIENWFKNIM